MSRRFETAARALALLLLTGLARPALAQVDSVWTGVVHPDLPPVTFRVADVRGPEDPDGFGYTSTLDVRVADSVLQHIEVRSQFGPASWLLDYPGADSGLADVNFDGYRDLVLATGYGREGRNASFHIWLFDPDSTRFAPSEEFSGLVNFRLDEARRRLHSRTEGGCVRGCFWEEVFDVGDDRLVLVEEVEQFWDEQAARYRQRIRRYEDGEVVSEEVVDVPTTINQ